MLFSKQKLKTYMVSEYDDNGVTNAVFSSMADAVITYEKVVSDAILHSGPERMIVMKDDAGIIASFFVRGREVSAR